MSAPDAAAAGQDAPGEPDPGERELIDGFARLSHEAAAGLAEANRLVAQEADRVAALMSEAMRPLGLALPPPVIAPPDAPGTGAAASLRMMARDIEQVAASVDRLLGATMSYLETRSGGLPGAEASGQR
jgi:hypothetical protein